MHGDYTLDYLSSLPTLAVGQADDLKIDDGQMRVWLSRMTVEDGAPTDGMVSIEWNIGGTWMTTEEYPAR